MLEYKLYVELYDIPKEFLQSEEKLRQVIGDGIVIGNLHPVGDVYYKFQVIDIFYLTT